MKAATDVWIPDTADELLLDIVMNVSADASDCFKQWRKLISWENAPGRVYFLLPFVYYCLQDSDIPGPDKQRLAGVARKVTLMNQMLFGVLKSFLKQLSEHGIQCWLTGELLMLLLIHDAVNRRPVHKLEIAVSQKAYQTSREILIQHGFIPISTGHYINQAGICRLRHDKLPIALVLYREDRKNKNQERPAGAWAKLNISPNEEIVLQEYQAEELLFSLCLQGILGSTEIQLDWILDVCCLLQAFPALDWQLVAARFIAIGLPWHGLQIMHYLRDTRNISIPDAALSSLQQQPISYSEQLLYKNGTNPKMLSRFIFHWQRSRLEDNGWERVKYLTDRFLYKISNIHRRNKTQLLKSSGRLFHD